MAITNKGYVTVLCPGHPRADINGRVFEHILVWEKKTGVNVPRNCVIHHINGNKSDNRIENLCMMDFGAHTVLHHTGTKLSSETKAKISHKAKVRFSDKKNHPFYKDVDVSKMIAMREDGAKVEDICKVFGITRRTYYNKLEDYYA